MRSSEIDYLIEEYVNGRKASRNRWILRMYYLDGYTYEQIAEKAGMSAVQIGRIIRRYGDPILLRMKK